jgi:aspartate kinase
MLELASLGAKVLQPRSVEFAMKYNVPIHVRSSFNDDEGSWVTQEVEGMESVLVSGIAYDKKEAKVTLHGVPDTPGIAARIFGPLAEAHVAVDMIIQNRSDHGRTDVTFTVAKTDLARAIDVTRAVSSDIGATGVDTDPDIAKISIVGVGMRSHAGVAAKMFETLAKSGINIQMISTSEIKVSCIIEARYLELAVRDLHDAFALHEEQIREEQSFGALR